MIEIRNAVAPKPRQMYPGERSDRYIRTVGVLPPHWSSDECGAFDWKVREMQRAYGSAVTPRDAAYFRRWLRRYGYDVA